MKKKITIIIYFFALGILAWFFQDSKSDRPAIAIPEQKLRISENEKKGNVEILKEDVGAIEIKINEHFNQYLNTLPTAEDFKTLSYEEVHHTPEIIKNGGAIIGRIHSEAQEDVSKRVSAMSFFKSCAEDEKVVPAIRAVCLKKIYKLIPEWKVPVILSEEKISKEVTDLAMKIP
jgi:hypothetical protein